MEQECVRTCSARWSLVAGISLLTLAALPISGCGGGGGNGGGGGGGSTSTITSVAASCASSSIKVSQTVQCSATVTGTGNFSQALTWSVQNIPGGNATTGTISTSGLYTAPSLVPTPASITITATSQQDSSKASNASIAVHLSIALSSPPSSVTVYRTVQFTPTIIGVTNTAVNWAVNGIAGGDLTVGQIDSSGVYTAPNLVPSPAAVTVSATSQVDSTQSVSAGLTILGDATAPTIISTIPSNGATGITVSPAISAQFSEAMDASSINPTTVTLSNGTNNLPADVRYDPSSTSVSILPRGVLSVGQTYTVAIAPSASDLAENQLSAPYSWNFTVETASSIASTVNTPMGLDPRTLTAVSFGGKEAVPDSNGSFTAQIHPEGVSLIAAVAPGRPFALMTIAIQYGSMSAQSPQAHSQDLIEAASSRYAKANTARSSMWQVSASPLVTSTSSNIQIDLQTTAEAYLFLTPYFYHRDPTQAGPILATIAVDPNTASLATILASTWQEADPFQDPNVQAVVQKAVTSILGTLSAPATSANPNASSSAEDQTPFIDRTQAPSTEASTGLLPVQLQMTPNCWSSTNHLASPTGLPCEDLDFNTLAATQSPDASGKFTVTPDNQNCPSSQFYFIHLGCATSWLVRVVPASTLPAGGISSITPGQGSGQPDSPAGGFDPPGCTLLDHSACSGFFILQGESSFASLDVVADMAGLVSQAFGFGQTPATAFQIAATPAQNYVYRAYSGGFADGTEFSSVWSGSYSNGRSMWSAALAENAVESGMELIDAAGVLPQADTNCVFKQITSTNTLFEIANDLAATNFDSSEAFQQAFQLSFNTLLTDATADAEACTTDTAIQGIVEIAGNAGKWLSGVGTIISALQAGSNVGQVLQRAYELRYEASPVETAFISVNGSTAQPSVLQVSCPNNSMVVGQTQTCSVQPVDAQGHSVPIGQSSFTWSTNSRMATFVLADSFGSSARVTAVAQGSAILTVTSARSSNGPSVSGSVKITITPPTLAKIVVSPSSLTVPAGRMYQLVAQGFDSNNHSMLLNGVNWTTSNSSVATISSSSNGTAVGTLSTIATGLTTITASSSGVQAATSVTVTPAIVAGSQIALGQVINGTLADTAPFGHCNYGAPSDRYLLDLSAQSGPTVVSVSGSSTAFDSFVCLLDASSNVIAADDDSAGSLNSLTTVSLAPGQYFVEISSFGASGAGPYILTAASPVIAVPGTISPGVRSFATLSTAAAAGRCNSGRPADRWMFTLATTTTVTIDVTSSSFDTFVCLLNSSNAGISSDDNSGSGTNSRLIYQNLTAGTYYIEVSSNSSGNVGGTYALSLQQGLPPGKPISIGSRVPGGLQGTAAKGRCNSGVPADRWMFTLATTTTVTIDVTSSSFDTFVCLLNSSNAGISSDDNSGSGTNSRLIYQNLTAGTYYIEVSSNSFGSAGGNYALSLQQGLPPGTPISIGSTATGNLTNLAAKGRCNSGVPADRWMFTLATTTTVTIDVTSSSFDTFVCLLNSSNAGISSDDNSGSGTNSRLIYQNLAAGTYYIEVSSSSSGNAGGTYALSLQQGLPPGTPISVGSTATGNLTSLAAKGRCNSGVPADRWMFTLATTTTVTIDVTSSSFDTFVCLLNSSNAGISSDDNSGSGTNSRLICQNLTAGTYYIEVSSNSFGSAGGTYALSLQQGLPPGTPISVGSTATGNLTSLAAKGRCNSGVPADRWMFTLATTTTVTIDVTSSSFDTFVCLLNSSNAGIGSNDNAGGSTNSEVITTLGASSYYVEVSASSGSGGSYTLSIH